MSMHTDIILVDKPKGITSFDVIRMLRKKLGIKKMGHAGTLDPLATGLMIIGIGNGTKKLTEYLKLPKEYIAEIRLGERTTTGDLEGRVLATFKIEHIDTEYVKRVLAFMRGTITLPVSPYSAIKKNGVPYYKRAREAEQKGELMHDVPEREMEVFDAELVKAVCKNKRCVLTIRFNVGSGTYIRSLSEELGRRLGCPSTLQNLRRTKIGDFAVEQAEKLKK